MIRLLMAGTALAAVLTTAAFAQSSSATPDDSAMSSAVSSAMSSMDSSQMSDMPSSSAMDTSAMSSQMSTASSMDNSMMSSVQPFSIISGYTVVDTDQLATKILGAHVYDSAADNANDLGKINDLVLGQSGSIAAVVVGVGGFLGIGEKQVAVDYHALQWQVGPDGNRRFVLQTTKDELTQAPDFKTVDNGAASSMGSSMSGASSSAQ